MICLPTSIGVALVARDFVPLLLGPQWLDLSPIVAWLALEAGIFHLVNPMTVLLRVTGRPAVAARVQWLRLGLLAIVLGSVSGFADVVTIAAARFSVTVVLAPLLIGLTLYLFSISVTATIHALWRPFAAAALMTATVVAVQRLGPATPPVRLVAEIGTGAIIFPLMMWLLWSLAGRPSGAEASTLALVKSYLPAPLRRAAL